MLVDLGRNDLSRVCRAGERPRRALHGGGALLARHPPRLGGRRRAPRRACGAFDLLRACFPAGTVSGAPKVRAMQIISELEGYRRGPYAGAVGYALPGRRPRHVHRDPDDRPPRRRRAPPGGRGDRRRLRPARRARGVPPQAGRPRDARLPLPSDDPARRQLRLVHLQPRPPVPGARAPRWSSGGTTRSTPTRPSGCALAPRRLPRPRAARSTRARPSRSSAGSRPRRRRSASASATRRSSRRSAARSGRRASSCTARRARSRTTAAGSSPGCRSRFQAGRYHSLAATQSSPRCSRSRRPAADGEVMAVRHRTLPVDGVQFHPESVLTPRRPRLCRNFLEGGDPARRSASCSTGTT